MKGNQLDIISRIFAGETICPSEIRIMNADRIMRWVRATDRHHDAKGCKVKNCVHRPGAITVDFAATIMSEAANVCVCGEHGTDDPDAAKSIGDEFIRRWE